MSETSPSPRTPPPSTPEPHPRATANFRNLAIGLLKTLGVGNLAKTTRAIRDQPERALPVLGITNNPEPQGT
ncbi:hypothetical protein AB0M29_43960 [Streptomyces sp. NPDC051976]|uniref:hypothetical protein n=1 Tax=Streptomyces sp. NPDC051976 TaxID=3154947 RepID=UPI00341A7900